MIMKAAGLTLLFCALFAGLCYLAAVMRAPAIQSSIQASVVEQLAKNNLPAVVVQADGRNITLSGELASQTEISQAIKITRHRPGVDTVINALTTRPQTSSATSTSQHSQSSKKITP